MRSCYFPRHNLSAFVCLIAITSIVSTSLAQPKLRPEEIVSKHLDSIASAETRATLKSIIAAGKVTATFRAPGTAQLAGQVVMASEANKSIVAMIFENSKYSQEKFGFDGEEVTVSYVRPGMHSSLGDFLLTHKVVLKHGLAGGTLSTAWPLLGLTDKVAKLEYGGSKKIGNRQTYELKYLPRHGSDLEIRLYFDAENFQHLRTEYARVITARLGGNIDASASQRQSRYKMIEDFSDFKKVGALTLPHSYKFQLELDTTGGSYRAEWESTLLQFSFNEPIPHVSFNVKGSN